MVPVITSRGGRHLQVSNNPVVIVDNRPLVLDVCRFVLHCFATWSMNDGRCMRPDFFPHCDFFARCGRCMMVKLGKQSLLSSGSKLGQ
ncbi:unnamed protein product [Urochloa humidicola]